MTSALVQMPVDIPMTALNYTLPPPIYLPSSGGYTGSRFTEDVSVLYVVRSLESLTCQCLVSHIAPSPARLSVP